MDLVTVTGYRSVSELMDDDCGMDSFEYNCWLNYWKENLFGPFADNYLSAQIAGHAQHAFGGGSWKVDKLMLKINDSRVQPEEISAAAQEQVAFEMMSVFGGIEKAKKWQSKGDSSNAGNQ